jgi:para-nitrobenzyl esterase
MIRLSVVAAVFAFGCSTTTPSPDAGMAPPGPTTIMTDKGAVEGTARDTSRAFLGIPYVAPPIGPLRWKPPAEAAAWSGTKPAMAYGHDCPQVDLVSGKATPGGNEDCLFLNVWTPLAAPSKPAPVMVFIHGGGFVLGSGSGTTYDGAKLAEAGAIVVNFNYRLGPFGFLEHSLLAAEVGKPASPAWGLLDQRAALQWVQRNIAAFGGDPKNVTVFGESAGAISVCMQLAMAGSKGLFQRALIESSSCGKLTTATPAAALKQGDDFATALGCADLACMRSKSTDEVGNALMNRPALFGKMGVTWSPVIDGTELAKVPNDAFASGDAPQMPVLIGTNKDEGNLFTYAWLLAFGHEITQQDVLDLLPILFTAPQIQAIQGQYAFSSYPSAKEWANAMLTDGFFVCPTRQTARALAAHGNPTWLYQFSYPFNPPLYANIGVAHSFELPFVFGTGLGGRNIGDDERPTSDAMIGYWTRFAATGDPNGGGAPAWPKYDMAGDQNIVLDAKIGTASGLKKTQCDFWDGL